MAAVIRIEVVTSGGAAVDQVKKDLSEVGKAAEESGKGFSAMQEIATGALRAVGEGLVGLAVKGFGALHDAISDGIDDAKQTQILNAQTAAVIKSTGEAAGVSAQHVSDYASSLSDAAGKSLFGDDQIQQSTNLLLTFTNIKGASLDAATAISVDMAQALGGAPKDAAIQLGKALNDPEKGIAALTRVGVTFTEEQKAQIQAMQEAGDTAGAQQVILAELNKEFGGSAEAAAQATGGWSEFNGRLGEAKEALGAALLPLLSTLAGVLLTDVMPVVEQVAASFAAWMSDPATQEGIRQLADAITNGLAVAFNVLTTQVIPTLLSVWATIQPAIAAILPLFQGEMPAGLATAGAAFNQLQATIQVVMAGVQAVINAILPQITAFWKAHGQEIMEFVQTTWNRIMEIIRTALQLIAAIVGPALQALAAFISAHGAEIQALLTNTWNAAKAIIDAALTLIQGVIKAALQIIQGDWSGAWQTIQQMCARIVQDIWTVIQSGINNIVTLFGGMADQVISTLNNLVSQAASVGSDIVQGIIHGVENAAGALYDKLKDMASGALQAAKDALGISSPSKVFEEEVGAPLVQGLMNGIEGMIPGLVSTLDNVAMEIIMHTKKVTEKVVDEANKIQDEIVAQAEGIGDKVANVLADSFSGTASLDRAKAKAVAMLKDISKAQIDAVQAQLADASAKAAGFGDPKQGAAFFQMRSNQIMELAKLSDQIDAAKTQADKDRLIEQYNLIGKAQQAELDAFGAKGTTSPVTGIMDQIQKLFANPHMPGQFDDPTGAIASLFNALPQLSALVAGGPQVSSSMYNSSQFTYAPTINTAGHAAPMDMALATSLAGV